AYLRERLPEYMAPGWIELLESLPLTPNGKVDRKALPAPEAKGGVARVEYVGPRTPVAEFVSGIFAEVLKRERVWINEDLFEAGGHSLLATQVTARVRKLLGVETPLRSLFENPTVSGLSREVEEALRGGAGRRCEAMKAVSREGDLPLSFAQQRLWVLDQLELGNASHNIPMAVRLTGQLDFFALEEALNIIVKRHEILRTIFAVKGGRPIQVIKAPLRLNIPCCDLRELSEERRGTEMM